MLMDMRFVLPGRPTVLAEIMFFFLGRPAVTFFVGSHSLQESPITSILQWFLAARRCISTVSPVLGYLADAHMYWQPKCAERLWTTTNRPIAASVNPPGL